MTTTLTRSFGHTAALTGAALLFTLACAGEATAQASTRYVTTCYVQVQPDDGQAGCQMTVPAGKVFVIEGATAFAGGSSSQWIYVALVTRFEGGVFHHYFPAGFQVLSNSSTKWTGALPGPIFSEEGTMTLVLTRGPSASGYAAARVTLSGRLEDM